MNDLASLLLAFERHGRPIPKWSGTPGQVLVATMAARLQYNAPGLAKIAQLADLPLGTVKASRSRVKGLRRAMDSIGQGPRDDFADELAVVENFVRSRPSREIAAWSQAAGCPALHRIFDAYPEDGPDDSQAFMNAVPARDAFERLWGADAWLNVEFLDLGHRFAFDPPRWAVA